MSSKSDLRAIARKKRCSLKHSGFAEALAAHAAALEIAPGAIVGGYHAMTGEADPALLLARLVADGCHIALPRVVGKHQPLEFHRIPEGEVLRPSAFGVHEPLAHWPVVTPTLLLVPLLAFDRHGYRLGYGGGYYDRTLAFLKNARAIGIAYAGQEVDGLPREAHDMRLDAVLTEKGLHQIKGTSR